MADVQCPYWVRRHDAWQVVLLSDRTSAYRVDTVRSCELNGRLTLRVLENPTSRKPPPSDFRPLRGVTYVPGLFVTHVPGCTLELAGDLVWRWPRRLKMFDNSGQTLSRERLRNNKVRIATVM